MISLLLLEPDSETVAGTLTKLAQRPWMTDDEIDSRAWAGTLLRLGQYWSKWKALIWSALEQVKLQERIEAAREDGQDKPVLEGEWSKPMTKAAIMKSLGLDSYKTLKSFSTSHPIQEAGSKKLWRIRLDGLNKMQIEKLTKV